MVNLSGHQQIPKISVQFIENPQRYLIVWQNMNHVAAILMDFKFCVLAIVRLTICPMNTLCKISQLYLFAVAHFCGSVALTVDNPELFNRIAETFSSTAALRFVILLWGDKSCLESNFFDEVPVYNYKEIIQLGRESRMTLLYSHDASKLLYIRHQTLNRRSCSTVEC